MGSGPTRPGHRGFRPEPRPQAFVPDVVPPVQEGARPRVGFATSRHPSRRFRFPQRPKAYETYGGGSGAVSGFGPIGAGVLQLSLEPGTKTTYAWSTDIVRTYSGLETRSSPFPQPRRRFEGAAFMLDASSRDTRGALMKAAAAGSTFLLALPHEEITVATDTAPATTPALSVASTAICDWMQVAQRIAVIGPDGTTALAVIQSFTATTVTIVAVDKNGNFLFSGIGAAGKAGAVIRPLVPVLLDPQQGFARFPVNVDLWTVHAQASAFGWTGLDVMGVNATVYTYTAGGQVGLSRVTDADLLVWDRPNAVTDSAAEGMLSGAETLDLGALPTGFGDQTVADWQRHLLFSSSSFSDWQWLKAFLWLCRGRQRAFLLSTNRPDLVYVSAISNGIKVQSSAVAGGGDYASWWASAAHRRLAIADTTGLLTYVTVTAQPVDNGDGTLSLTLDNNPSSGVAKISLAELVRLDNNDNDELAVTWDGAMFTLDVTARTVQDIVVPPLAFMFDLYLSQTYAYSPPPPPPTDQEFAFSAIVAGSPAALLYASTDRTLSFGGISNGAPFDGQVFVVAKADNTAFGMTIIHEDTTWAPSERILVPGRASTGGTMRCYWFVFCAALQRWVLWKFS